MRFPLAAVLVATLAAAPAPAPAPPAAIPGNPVPAFSAKTLDGAPVTGAATGKVTVLNFWATWCPPCRAETPDLIAAYNKLHGSGVVFLGVDTTETAPIVKTFLSAKGVPYPTELAGPDVYDAFGIIGIPTTVVVDANGVVRARWVGGVTPAQLTTYVDAARAGRNATFVSATQATIDAMLAPAHFDFTDAAKREAAMKAMNAAIDRAETIADKDETNSVDYERTVTEEGTLRVAAGTAVRDAATTDAQRVRGLTLIARGDGDLGRFADAVQAYQSAIALAPADAGLIASLGRAYYRLHDYAQALAQAQRYTELKPNDGDGWSDLGLEEQRVGKFHDAVAPYEKSLALLRAAARKTPTQDAIADVADTSLDLADVYVSLGDEAGAKRTFAQANAYGDRLAANGEYKRLKRNVKERTQEGLIAVALAGGSGKPVVSIAPWTGPDLPGSVASTLKYRLIVAAPANTAVTLRATGLRPAWVASFCTDGLCSPQQVSYASPASGVKTYEFQLIPPQNGAKPGRVAIEVAGGTSVSVPQ